MALENWWEAPSLGAPAVPPAFLGASAGGASSFATPLANPSPGLPGAESGGGSGATSLLGPGLNLAAPLIASAFGGSNPAARATTQGAADLTTLGRTLSGSGQAATAPVLKLLQALVSGDPAALQAVTQPQRARVLDQYDTARQAITRTAPRGGGNAGTMAQSYLDQGRDLATTTNTARNSALGDLAQIGSQQTAAGEQALAQALQVHQMEAQRRAGENHNLGSTIGGFLQMAAPLLLAL